MAHRTQLYLDDSQYGYLKDLAKATKKSIAQVIRDWIEEKRLKKQKKISDKKYLKDPIFKLRGLFASGCPDMAENFDDYLYGDKK